nr:SonC [Paraconiothyrium archidendri]
MAASDAWPKNWSVIIRLPPGIMRRKLRQRHRLKHRAKTHRKLDHLLSRQSIQAPNLTYWSIQIKDRHMTVSCRTMTVLLPDNDCTDPRQPDFYNFADLTTNTPWSNPYDPEMTAFCFDNESRPTVPSSTAGESSCHCISQAVVTYEAIEVAAWGRRKFLNDFDVLQSQKMALAECERLVECQNCNVQPPYIMLLLSMFRRILRTLEDICTSKGPKGLQAITTAMDHEPPNRKRSRLSVELEEEGRASRQGYSGNTDNLKLDDEDKHLVLQSLLTARIGKSHHVLNMIDKAVSRHTWPAHEDLVRELRNRLTEGVFIIHRKQLIP